MGKQEISWLRSGVHAHNDNFHTRVSSFIGQHFGKKIGLLPTAGAENHAFGGFTTPPTYALKVWENATDAKSPGPYCKVMSSAQEHLSVICAKFLQLQVAQIRTWKLCGKPFQGLLLGTRGTENFTQCLTMKLWSGANFWHQFRARPWKWPAQVLGRVGHCGLMERSSNAHNFLIFRRNALKFSPFVDGLPYYKLMPVWAWWK